MSQVERKHSDSLNLLNVVTHQIYYRDQFLCFRAPQIFREHKNKNSFYKILLDRPMQRCLSMIVRYLNKYTFSIKYKQKK